MNKLSFPNPIFIREETEYLNDGWLFSYDNVTWQPIRVPYAPESILSGIGNTDFIRNCYYKKKFTYTKKKEGALLYFGAVDYKAVVYLNGMCVGMHIGGHTTFSLDITAYVQEGENELFLIINDETVNSQAHGKQSFQKDSWGCFYTRTTGIWQNVWLEHVSKQKVREFYFYPSIKDTSVTVDLITNGNGRYAITVEYDGKKVGFAEGEMKYREKVKIPLNEAHLWALGKGEIYDVILQFEEDTVYSYFGLREVEYKGYDFYLNGEKIYQKLVLDQGYFPDGIMTAPSVEAMEADIDRGLRLGFNGARLHQKIFDPKMIYLCDKKGYMTWGEMPSWGVDYSTLGNVGQFITEWEEAMKRDFNHPSIILWCPLNEVWGALTTHDQKRDIRFIDAVYQFTKLFDTTRPVIDVSGGHHGNQTDVFDFHCYEGLEKLKQCFDELTNEDKIQVQFLDCIGEESHYKKGCPVLISECGGAVLKTELQEGGWGYREGETDADAFVENYEKLIALITDCKKISGFCYTQLYDIEQEQNGFYRYDRSDKLTEKQKDKIREINAKYPKN